MFVLSFAGMRRVLAPRIYIYLVGCVAMRVLVFAAVMSGGGAEQPAVSGT